MPDSHALTLPLRTTSLKSGVIVIPILMITPFFTSAVVYYALHVGNNNLSDQMRQLIPIGWFILSMPINFFAISRMKPRNLIIDVTSIDITPIPVLGYKTTVPETRSISEFKSVDYVKQSGGRSGPVYFVYLRSAQGNNDLAVDPPQGVDKHQFVAQLGAALNLKVNDNVRN